MRISDWSSDVCSSDLNSPSSPTGIPKRAVTLCTHFGACGSWLPSMTYRPEPGAVSGSVTVQPPPQPGTARPGSSISRSEEHTSELQSLMRISYAVFCLKKKTHLQPKTYTLQHIQTC